MTHSLTKRKQDMTAALQSAAGEVWAMEPRSFTMMIANMAQMASTGEKPEAEIPQRQTMMMAETDSGLVAVIPITGVIRPMNDAITRRMGGTALSAVVAEYLQALSNSQVSQIVFYLDTPGGSVAGLSDFTALIEQNATKKPTTAFIGPMCASAGYWIAAAVPNVRATGDSLVGSIGVVVMDVSVARAWKEFGVDIDMVHFGSRKVDGHPFAAMSAGRHDAFQEQVDEYGMAFVNHVAKFRKVSPETVRAEFGDGKVYPGRKALTRGMIDAVVPMFGNGQASATTSTANTGNRTAQQTTGAALFPLLTPTVAAEIAVAAIEPLKPLTDLPQSIGINTAINTAIHIDMNQIAVSAVQQITPAAIVGSAAYGTTPKAAITTAIKENNPMATSARVKSALYATGFTQNQDAPDAVCEAALSAFYLAKGVDQPTDEKQLLADLASVLSKPVAITAAAPLQPTKPSVSAEDYRDRLASVQAIADLANVDQPGAITQAMVMEAVNADDFKKPIDAIQREWKEKVTAVLPKVAIVGSGVDRLKDDIVAQLVYKGTDGRAGKQVPALQRAQPIDLIKESFNATGIRLSGLASDDKLTMAEYALGLQPEGISAAAGPVNRVGDFVNIMSAVQQVMMDDAAARPELSFRFISDELPEADSMDPTSIGGYGVIDGLDAHVDGTDAKEIKLREESKGFIVPTLYANDICLTALMVIDPMKFNMFLRAMSDMLNAGPRTLNRSIIAMIGGNVPLIDGLALFENTVHLNLVGSGGAPSETNLITNRALHAAQRAPGMMSNSGTDPRIVLVPDALKITAAKAFQTFFGTANGTPIANIESSQNYFKDSVMVVADPELDNYSTTAWYSLVAPSNQGLRSLVHRYRAGYGPSGKRGEYTDYKKRGRSYTIDFAAGAAIAGWRGIVRNPG
jgi:signal peptide peptidase SppA